MSVIKDDKTRKRIEAQKRSIEQRLSRESVIEAVGRGPLLGPANIKYELAGRAQGVVYGGIGLVHQVALQSGLVAAINRHLHLLKLHLPYHESDHVLNFAYNALCEGQCLEDIELRRNDAAFLDAVGAQRIPDPTTAGDFCRRFTKPDHIENLHDAIDEARLTVWAQQPKAFFAHATIDMDGHLVGTNGECKNGMDRAYDGTWGYQALVVSLAETGEVLSIKNSPGNRPSHEGAAAMVDRSIGLCRRGGFQTILLRGDTDFSQTQHLDRWDAEDVLFHFGYDSKPNLEKIADELPETAWKKLERPPKYEANSRRRRPSKVKEQIVEDRQYENKILQYEEVAEFEYRPLACRKTYRMIVIRKNIRVKKGQRVLFDTSRYFFYITNDRTSTPSMIVFSCNRRCNQENLVAQLSSGVRALQAPVDNLLSNWAFMVMTALAWNLKAWCALWLPEDGDEAEEHRAEKYELLRMEFRTFVNAMIKIPAQIVKTGRRIIYLYRSAKTPCLCSGKPNHYLER